MRTKLGLATLICILIFGGNPAGAQQKGQYIPGQQGLNAGVLPDPGFTYANMTINYSADTLRNGGGTSVPLAGSYDIWAIENIFYYVPKFKLLGAKLAFLVVAPTLANGSLTLGSLQFPNVAINAGGFGVADTWVQPVTLGWNLKRADVYVGYAFMAPTGRYTPGASDNVGSGYWGNHLQTGRHRLSDEKQRHHRQSVHGLGVSRKQDDGTWNQRYTRPGIHDGMGAGPSAAIEEGFQQTAAARLDRI